MVSTDPHSSSRSLLFSRRVSTLPNYLGFGSWFWVRVAGLLAEHGGECHGKLGIHSSGEKFATLLENMDYHYGGHAVNKTLMNAENTYM